MRKSVMTRKAPIILLTGVFLLIAGGFAIAQQPVGYSAPASTPAANAVNALAAQTSADRAAVQAANLPASANNTTPVATGVTSPVAAGAAAPGTPGTAAPVIPGAVAPCVPAAPGTLAPGVVDPCQLPLDHSPFQQSFLFTPAEIVAIRSAASGSVAGSAVLGADKTMNIPARRVISIAGVYFRGPTDWTVWINGKKMTPKELLPEVMAVKVSKDQVSLKWFDIGLNDVLSITLRPHQTYDIVTGVLLPG